MTRVVSRCQAVVPERLTETRFVSFHTLGETSGWFARLKAFCARAFSTKR